MKYLVGLVIVLIVAVYPFVERVMPWSNTTGEIISISDRIEDPLPHKLAEIETRDGKLDAVVYESNANYKIGEVVILQNDPQFKDLYSVTDKVRTTPLIRLFLIFLVVIIAVSGIAGIRAIIGLLFSFGIIFKFVLPQIVLGSNAVTVALLASGLILSISYYLTHGINHKSTIAIFGTLGALVITGVVASLYASASKLTGLGSEEAGFLLDKMPIESFYNLLLAGIIIGSLGVLDDITISQASIVEELSIANKKWGMQELYTRAMRIGRDHISSLVNTLVLVYAGSSLPLLLLFVTSDAGVLELLNYEMVAEEIVRTLVGSIGLVVAVPLTTFIAATWYSQKY